jgi:CysZ protein
LPSFLYAFKGLALISRAPYRTWATAPLIINAFVFSALAAVLFTYLGSWLDAVVPRGGWLEYLRWLVWPLAAATAALAGLVGAALVGNLIAAPFNERLAARILVELGTTGLAAPVAPFTRTAARAVTDELRKAGYLAGRVLLVLPLFLIPGVNVVAPVAWFLLTSWLLALEYADYPLTLRGVPLAEQRRLLRSNRLTALGFGAGVMVLLLIPVVNFAAIPAAVAGATLLWADRWKTGGPT